MFGRRSTSGWEDSYFGGYSKVLTDYPDIKVPYVINTWTPKTDEFPELTYHTKNKLLDLFQLKIKEFDIKEEFLYEATVEAVKSFFGEKKVLVASKEGISLTLSIIIEKDTELANMFAHYKELILNSKFIYPIEENSKKEEGESGDKGEGEGNDEENPEREELSVSDLDELQKAIASAMCLIEQIEKRRNSWAVAQCQISGNWKEDTVFKLMPSGGGPVIYKKEEILYAGQLVKMLDISFDPTHDKVDNLKTGKLDTGKLASVPAGNHHVYYRVEDNQTTRPFSICILMDESGSMGGPSYAYANGFYQQSIVKVLYKAFSEIIPPGKIFIYGHSSIIKGSKEVPHIRIYNDNFNQVFETTILGQNGNSWANNYDGPVIECVYERVRQATDDNIIFISISDGLPEGVGYGGKVAIEDMKRIIEKCKRDGFVTIGIGIQHGGVKDIYNYHTVVQDMTKMVKQVSMIVNHVVKTEFQT